MGSKPTELIAAELGSDWPSAAAQGRGRASLIDGPDRRAGRGGDWGVLTPRRLALRGSGGTWLPVFAAACAREAGGLELAARSPRSLDERFRERRHFAGR